MTIVRTSRSWRCRQAEAVHFNTRIHTEAGGCCRPRANVSTSVSEVGGGGGQAHLKYTPCQEGRECVNLNMNGVCARDYH